MATEIITIDCLECVGGVLVANGLDLNMAIRERQLACGITAGWLSSDPANTGRLIARSTLYTIAQYCAYINAFAANFISTDYTGGGSDAPEMRTNTYADPLTDTVNSLYIKVCELLQTKATGTFVSGLGISYTSGNTWSSGPNRTAVPEEPNSYFQDIVDNYIASHSWVSLTDRAYVEAYRYSYNDERTNYTDPWGETYNGNQRGATATLREVTPYAAVSSALRHKSTFYCWVEKYGTDASMTRIFDSGGTGSEDTYSSLGPDTQGAGEWTTAAGLTAVRLELFPSWPSANDTDPTQFVSASGKLMRGCQWGWKVATSELRPPFAIVTWEFWHT